MDCVVIAGGTPEPDDPLYVYTQGEPKALLDMEGRTMLERVIDALQSSQYIDRIVIVGLKNDMGMEFQFPIDHYLPDQGSMVGNVLAGLAWLRQGKPDLQAFLACTSDVPLITGPIVDSYIERCEPFDKGVYYILVTKEAMEARFPHSNRTYVKFKGVEGAGGDMAIVRVRVADANRDLWEALSNARKHAWQLARIVGLRVLLKYLLRDLSMADIEREGERIVDQPVQIVLDPPAELAMDADKPAQVEMLRAELRRMQMSQQ